jgi:IS4 transposase
MLDEAFALFLKAAPATVLIRGVLENIFSVGRLNAIFEDAAQSQYTRDLAFSSVVRLMSQVVMRIQPSVHSAYRQQAEELGVSAKCVYDKLDGIEPCVSQELVRRLAREMELVIRTMGGALPPRVDGLRTRILDGNHLGATDRRLGALRGQTGAALPGQSLAVLDPELRLIVDLFPCEDAHTQERALLGQVLQTVQAGDLWIEDRNFCTTLFLFGVHRRNAFFIVRQHAKSLRWEPVSEFVYVGEIARGRVFEQQVRLRDEHGGELVVRRIRIDLNEPTRDGETVIHILTNLRPEQADALRVAELYSDRWQVETAFQELTVDLACEVSTLGYPKAALFAFATAVSCYNAFSVTKAALRAAAAEPAPCVPTASEPGIAPAACRASVCQPAASEPRKPASVAARSPADDLSTYYLADEIAGTWRGMMVVLPEDFWQRKFAGLTPPELARDLRDLARGADLSKYQKRPRSRKPSRRVSPRKPGSHVSTARMLPDHKR